MATDDQALILLRDYKRSHKPFQLFNEAGDSVESVADAKTIRFDDTTFACNVPTQFKKSAATSDQDTYTLDSIVFLTENAQLDNSAYLKACRHRNIEHVSIVDKKKILDYLSGKVDLPSSSKRKREGEDESKTTTGDDAYDHQAKRAKDFVAHLEANYYPLVTPESIMQGTKKLDHLIAMTHEAVARKDKGHRPQQKSASAKPSKGQGGKDRIPIIIVPAAPTAKITLFNVKQFLEQSQYVDGSDLRRQGIKKPERVTVEHRKPNGDMVVYHVVDNVSNFKQADWDRVACVFASGQLWQFKGWKYEKPVELFSHYKGFLPIWQGETISGPAANWNVKKLQFHRSRRHQDKAVASQFWDTLYH